MPRNELPPAIPGVHEANRKRYRKVQLVSKLFIPEIAIFQPAHLAEAQALHQDGHPLLFAPNHISFLDPLVIDRVLLKHDLEAVYITNKKYKEKRATKWFTDTGHTIDVWPNTIPAKTEEEKGEKRKMNMGALRSARKVLEQNRNLLVFFEGTRSKTGELSSAAEGVGGYCSLTPDTVVVPIGITGSNDVIIPHGKILPRRAEVSVTFGKPLTQEAFVPFDKDRDAKADFVMQQLALCLPYVKRGIYKA